MARENRSLSNAFNMFEIEPEDSTDKLKIEGEQTSVTRNSNTIGITKDVTLESNTATKQHDDAVKQTTVKEVTEDLLHLFQEKQNKLTVEETHVRSTFLLRRDLDKRLTKLARGKRGFKTLFLNKAIESLLDELEE